MNRMMEITTITMVVVMAATVAIITTIIMAEAEVAVGRLGRRVREEDLAAEGVAEVEGMEGVEEEEEEEAEEVEEVEEVEEGVAEMAEVVEEVVAREEAEAAGHLAAQPKPVGIPGMMEISNVSAGRFVTAARQKSFVSDDNILTSFLVS
jgi:hypothetical protein